nr:hypothetical protein [Micromonospora sp. 4G55]
MSFRAVWNDRTQAATAGPNTPSAVSRAPRRLATACNSRTSPPRQPARSSRSPSRAVVAVAIPHGWRLSSRLRWWLTLTCRCLSCGFGPVYRAGRKLRVRLQIFRS